MPHDVDTLTEQVLELQSQLAFQEDTLRSLDAAFALQQQEILLLRRQVELLLARQQEYEASNDAGVAYSARDELPPHY
ncbi:MAG: SlyX family protein [Haliea sp.]|jgi:SlyX protein|nr:SlyX family protein [Haliea sp.]MBK6738739.1 SlyX family protein [Haliea sp.]